MPENDAFEILGRIAVDIDALRASLREAEDEVEESADRQKQTYEHFALAARDAQQRAMELGPAGGAGPALYFGPGGAHEREQETEDIADQMKKTAGETANTTATIASGVRDMGVHLRAGSMEMRAMMRMAHMMNPALAGLSPTLGQLSMATIYSGHMVSRMGLAMGVAMGAAALLATTIGKLLVSVAALSKQQFELNRALATQDVGRAAGQYQQATEAVEEWKFQTQDILDIFKGDWISYIRGAIAANKQFFAFGDDLADRSKRQVDALGAWTRTFQRVEVPKSVLESLKSFAALLEKQSQLALTGVVGIGQILKGYAMAERAIRDRARATEDEIRLATKQELINKGIAEGTELWAAKWAIANRKIAASAADMFLALEKNSQARRRALLVDDAAVAESARRIAASEHDRAKNSLAADRAVLDSQRSLAEALAAFHGEAPEGAEAYLRRGREIQEKEFELERQNVKANFDSQEATAKAARDAAIKSLEDYNTRIEALEKEEVLAKKQVGPKVAPQTQALDALLAEEAAVKKALVVAWQDRTAAEAEFEQTKRASMEESVNLDRARQAAAARDTAQANEDAYKDRLKDLNNKKETLTAGVEATKQAGADEVLTLQANRGSLDALRTTERSAVEEHTRKLAEIRAARAAAEAKVADDERKANEARRDQEFQARIAQWAKETAAEDAAFQHRTKLGQMSLQEQARFFAAAAGDERRLMADRRKNAEDLWGMQQKMADQYFRTLQMSGANVTQGQIAYQLQFAATLRQGSDEWLTALEKVQAGYEKIQGAAKGVVDFVIQAATEEDKASGKKMSLGDMERAAMDRVRRDRELISDALSGSAVDTGLLNAARRRFAAFQQARAAGMSSYDALMTEVTPVANRMALAFNAVANTADSFRNAWIIRMGEVEQYAQGMAKRIMSSGIWGWKTSAELAVASSELGRVGQLENRRMPVPASPAQG